MECCCFVDYSLPTFKSAKKLLMNGTSAAEIYKSLTKAPKFKVALEVAGLTQPCDNAIEVLPISKVISATNAEAGIIVAPKILRYKNIKQPEEEEFGMLGNRTTPEKLESFKSPQKRKGIASYFKQTSSSGIQV
jgi:hypothetical protein